MDIQFVADILNAGQPALSSDLHSQLADTTLTHDGTTTPFGSLYGMTNSSQAGAVVSKIEDIFEKVAACILDEKKKLTIELKTRGKRSTTVRDAATGTIKSIPDEERRTVQFPSRSPKEAWKFTVIFRILELSHEAVVTGIGMTKRDMFYRDPELFIKQPFVDRYVDDLAYTLGVERDALNVFAAAKGLVAGSFKLTTSDNLIVDCSTKGMLIPNIRDIKSLQLQDTQWILVIEKEATFRTLAINRYWSTSVAGKGTIITAKGYPDIQTRQLLHLLSIHAPRIPIFALVDFDPDGLGIMSTYKYGSMALAHENQNLAVPSVRWLGIRSCDVAQDSIDKTGLQKLSGRDRRIAGLMLKKDVFGDSIDEETLTAPVREEEWRRELQVMLMLNVKAEIQILSSQVGLEGWLDGKLLQARFPPSISINSV